MNDARVRIGRVRMKNGGADVRVLYRPEREGRKHVERDMKDVLDAHGDDIAGYAIVVWGADCSSTASARSGIDSRIPTTMVPDFVRNRLFAERIEEWAVRAVMRRLGYGDGT